MKTKIKVVCCKCNHTIGYQDGKGVSGISHGICDNCLDREMEKIDMMNEWDNKDDDGKEKDYPYHNIKNKI